MYPLGFFGALVFASLGSLMATVGVSSWRAVLSGSRAEDAFGVVPITIGGLVMLAMAYWKFREAWRSKRILDATKAYMDYLREREIAVGVEFTQSKAAFERERSIPNKAA